ncbi:MAG: SpoIIE family protein phosphatase [Phycisphaera sp.]|nr:SpoIIE family protein phosphatase [Phycisphaera sp.]
MHADWVAVLDVFAALASMAAMATIPFIPAERFGVSARRILAVAVTLYTFVTTANALEHLGVTAAFDPVEDVAEVMFFPFVLFFFYAVRLWSETQQRLAAERHLRELNGVLESTEQVNRLLADQADLIQEDFSRAAEIHRTLLPRDAPDIAGVSVCAIYRPSHHVGGDLYDIVRLDDRYVGIYVADATGHGVAAAMLAMMFKNRLRLWDADAGVPLPPARVMADVNVWLAERCQGPGMFVTAAYGVLDTRTHRLTVASAGHPPVVLHRRSGDGEVLEVRATGPALGLSSDAWFGEVQVDLKPDDRLMMYTDGLSGVNDRRGATAVERVTDALKRRSLDGMEVLHAVLGSCNGTSGDDVTLLLVELRSAPSRMDNVEPVAPAEPVAAKQADSARCRIATGRSERGIMVRLEGVGQWTYAARFHDVGMTGIREALDDDVRLIFEFADCVHLDSTFLGTIHELAASAETCGVEVMMQDVSPCLRGLFEELGMDRVLRHVTSTRTPMPTEMTWIEDAADMQRGQQRVLFAHEALAALNEGNREQFGKLVEALRTEIRGQSGKLMH